MVHGSTWLSGIWEAWDGKRQTRPVARPCRPLLETLEDRLTPATDLGFGATLPIVRLEVETDNPRLVEANWPLPASSWVSPVHQDSAFILDAPAPCADAFARAFAHSPNPLDPPLEDSITLDHAIDLMAAGHAAALRDAQQQVAAATEAHAEETAAQVAHGFIVIESAMAPGHQEETTPRANRWAALFGWVMGVSQGGQDTPWKRFATRPARRGDLGWDQNMSAVACRAPPDWRRRILRLRLIAGGADEMSAPFFFARGP